MKTQKSITIEAILAVLGLVFISCENLNKTEYTVTFDSNGGSVINSQIVTEGEKVVRPANPTKNGFVFDNWYANEGLTVVYDFNQPVNSDITLYAKWNPENNEPGDDPGDGEDPEEPGDSEDPEDPENPGTNPGITYYTITFETFGGSEVPSQSVAYGARAVRPENPENGFYYFRSWYTDAEFTRYYYFEETVTADTTIYARWSFDSYLFKPWLEAQSGGNSPDDPVVLALQYDTSLASVLYGLGGTFGDPMTGKYVSLDFSNCTTVDGVFDGNSNNYPGITRIVSVIMPDSATAINGNMSSPVLKSVSGKGLEIIEGAFSGCTVLTDVDFPNLKTITGDAFSNCTALTDVDFPNLITIEGSAYGYGAFEGCTALANIRFPNLTCIGDGGAFERCTSLVSVDLPKVTSVGNSAFYNCTSLTDVNFLNAASIGDCAFYACTSLTDVSFPNATSIGDYAFAGDKYNPNLGLENVYLPKVTSIGKNAFADCTALTDIDLPQVTSIDDSAFYNCTALVSADFPSATTIGDDAFNGCTALTSVSFSAATNIGERAFSGCRSLNSFNLIGSGSLRVIADGKALAQGTKLILYLSATGSIELYGITSIGSYAFAGATLTSVSFPDAVSIEDYAFYHCWWESQVLNEDWSYILNPQHSLYFPKVKTIGRSAFELPQNQNAYSGLVTVSFPEAITIGDYAFKNNTGLGRMYGNENYTVDFPKVTTIGDEAFACASHVGNYFPVGYMADAIFPEVVSIGKRAFAHQYDLRTLDFPKATSIGEEAFYNTGHFLGYYDTVIRTVNFPKVTTIGEGAFSNISYFWFASFPEAITIGDRAFSGCSLLTSVNIPKVINIGNFVFRGSVNSTGGLTITMGNIAPQVGIYNLSSYDGATQTVTLKVPAGATGYGSIPGTYSGASSTSNWGNAFRGMGSDGTGTVNSDITLNIVYE